MSRCDAERRYEIRRCRCFGRGAGKSLRDAEVENERVIAGEDDVLRLDIAVDDSPRMRITQRLGHIANDSHRVLNGQLFRASDPGVNALPLDERHREVEE